MIGFLDVNAVWRRKFAEALGRCVTGTVLCVPHAIGRRALAEAGDFPVALPPGWAGRSSALAMPLLEYRLNRLARARNGAIDTLVLTTPHYWPLVRRAGAARRTVYYCSDDYRSYDGWDAERMTRDERALCRRAALSIFVSEALRARAVAEYDLETAKTFVSPNATEPRFAAPAERLPAISRLPGPVFGAAGVFNPRIDLDFLAALALDPRVGSLALVGPVEPDLEGSPALAALRASAKVHFFGRQPHAAMHDWMAAFDVAVIPYAQTALNHFCSPMRLYDHRAIGHPIIATRHCAQVTQDPAVLSGGSDEAGALIGHALAKVGSHRSHLETWDDRIEALRKSPVAAFLFDQ